MKKKFSRGFKWIKTHPWWTIIIFVAVLTSLLILPKKISSAVKGPEAKYQTVKVKKSDLLKTVSASGKAKAQSQADLKFQTSGLLAWVGVKEGDQVKKWQAIASLDKRQLHKAVEKDLNDYLNERWDFEQTRENYGVKGESLEKYLLSDAAKRILEKSQFDLNNSVIDVEVSDITEKLATIVTPIEGIVTNVDSPLAGVNVTPATANFTIADPKIMIFEAEIDEADIMGIKEGQSAKITLDAYPDQEFTGQISRLDFQSITTKGGGTAFKAEIALPENSDQRFKIGLSGDAEIILEKKDNALNIPIGTVQQRNGKSYVKIIDGRTVKEIEVQTGMETETTIEIKSGLTENQMVITGEKKYTSPHQDDVTPQNLREVCFFVAFRSKFRPFGESK